MKVGDNIIIMKGEGPGGKIILVPDNMLCVELGHYEDGRWIKTPVVVPVLVEREALLLDPS